MTELFINVREEVKNIAEMAWQVALRQSNPASAVNFLNAVTEFYKNLYTEEEIEFLQFYFNMKMEMMKE